MTEGEWMTLARLAEGKTLSAMIGPAGVNYAWMPRRRGRPPVPTTIQSLVRKGYAQVTSGVTVQITAAGRKAIATRGK
jgi:hypothetical protein